MADQTQMNILALETSCDDTAVAIVADGRQVLSSVIHTQTDLHTRYGGVVPEVAARDHLQAVSTTLEQALRQANLSLDQVDAFAATLGPGLIGSLLIGANTAKTLALMTSKPFLGVHHLYAHVASNYLESDLKPPFLCLLVSGGHTQLIRVSDYNQMAIIGETLDDAVGEAYDKVARLLKLPYPGGPHLDKLAQTGNGSTYKLPRAQTEKPLDFSFSGLKTAVLRVTEREGETLNPADLAASFQKTVVETLGEKTLRAWRDLPGEQKTLAVAGGVSANSGLRQFFQAQAAQHSAMRLYLPDLRFCTDNAAMVAASAYFNPITQDPGVEVFSRTVSINTAS